jgi:hypothetical protein
MRRGALALLLVIAACHGETLSSNEPSRARAVYHQTVLIAIVPPASDLPFDPRSARLVQATNELADVAGHPIQFEFDAALLPEWRSSFEDELIRSIENVTKDLTRLKKQSPRILARATGILDRIACHYQATAREAESKFDSVSRTLTIHEPPRVSSLVQQGLVADAIQEEFEAYLSHLYRGKMPDEVPRAEHAAYFEYLTLTRPGYGNLSERAASNEQAHLPEVDRLAADPHAETILRIARLGELLGGSSEPLSMAVREWLAGQAAYFEHTYETRGELLARIAQGCAWRRGEAAWVRWLNQNVAALSDELKVNLARVILPSRGRCRAGDPCADQPASFPGFDRIAFGLAVAEQWSKDGHPREGEGKRFELEDEVLCPHVLGEDGRRTRNRGCSAAFYQIAMASDATRARLVQELARRDDPLLVDEVFANSDQVPSLRVVATWRGLEPHIRQWQAAARVIIEHLLPEREHADAIVAEANRLWRDAPDKRGTALVVLTSTTRGLDRHYADPRWADFEKRYGEAVSQKVFAAYLDHGALAMKLVPMIWPALGKGYSRADSIVAHLDRFMADPGVQRGQDGEPNKTLRAIAGRMCDDNATQELTRLHAWIEQRSRSHTAESSALSTILADTARCKSPRLTQPNRD